MRALKRDAPRFAADRQISTRIRCSSARPLRWQWQPATSILSRQWHEHHYIVADRTHRYPPKSDGPLACDAPHYRELILGRLLSPANGSPLGAASAACSVDLGEKAQSNPVDMRMRGHRRREGIRPGKHQWSDWRTRQDSNLWPLPSELELQRYARLFNPTL